MIRLYHLFLISIAFNLSHGNSRVFKSGNNLSIRVQSVQEPDIIINGLNQKNFVRTNKPASIRILCNKQNGITAGKVSAFVNTQEATFLKCLEYDKAHVGDDVYCLKQEFRFELPAIGYSYFEVMCRYMQNENLSSVSTFLHRLYDDGIPRIRSGLYLDNLKSTVEHTVNLERVSCESIKSTSESLFNALQWFTAANKSIGFNTVSNQISENIYIYKSEFPAKYAKNNTIYKCCTILNGNIQKCQQFLANIYAPPSTSTTTMRPISTTTITSTTTTTRISTTVTTVTTATTRVEYYELIIPKAEPVDTQFIASSSTPCEKSKISLKTKNNKKGYIDSVNSREDSKALSNNEIGIILACTAGIFILALIIILALLCYKERRYGHENVKKGPKVTGKKLTSNIERAELPISALTYSTNKSSTSFSQLATIRLEEELNASRNTRSFKKSSLEEELYTNRNTCPMAQQSKQVHMISHVPLTNQFENELEANRNTCPFANSKSELKEEIEANRNTCPFANSKSELKEEIEANRNTCPFANSKSELKEEIEANRNTCPFAKKEKNNENEIASDDYPERNLKKFTEITSFRVSTKTNDKSQSNYTNSLYQTYLGVNKSLGTYGVNYSEPRIEANPPPPPPMPAPSLNENVSLIEVKKTSPDTSSFFPPPPPPIFGINQINKNEQDSVGTKKNSANADDHLSSYNKDTSNIYY